MCEFDHPDCLNCPYPDCNASVTDLRRQWRYDKAAKRRDSADSIQRTVGKEEKPVVIGTSYDQRHKRYAQSEKGRASAKHYEQSEKGKARAMRYQSSEKAREARRKYNATEKGRERYRRYYRKRQAMQEV